MGDLVNVTIDDLMGVAIFECLRQNFIELLPLCLIIPILNQDFSLSQK